MLSKTELEQLLSDIESDRVARTVSTNNTDKFSEAICAFANDFPNHKQPGYLIVGADDKSGRPTGIDVSDQLLQNLAAIRNNGQVLPQPSLTVQKFNLDDGEVAVVEVFPSPITPVLYKGRVWIRNGPTKAIANEAEINLLSEKRTSTAKTFDALPCHECTIDDLDVDSIRHLYLPNAIDPEILAQDSRSISDQLGSLRLFDKVYQVPTNGGILTAGKFPLYQFPGAYVQYVKYAGRDETSDVVNEKMFSGDLFTLMKELDIFVGLIITQRPVATSALRETIIFTYPEAAIRELLNNAVMHRSYDSNAPIKFYEFEDRLFISNPGGLYGMARPDNFPDQNDYRNPILAEALKILGYVNKFNRGIARAQADLNENGNPLAEFVYDRPLQFSVTVYINEDALEEPQIIEQEETHNSTREETHNSTREETGLSEVSHTDSQQVTGNSNDHYGTREETQNRTREETQNRVREETNARSILVEMKRDSTITVQELTGLTGLTRQGVEYHIKMLKKKGMIRRYGSTKSGNWVVTAKSGL